MAKSRIPKKGTLKSSGLIAVIEEKLGVIPGIAAKEGEDIRHKAKSLKKFVRGSRGPRNAPRPVNMNIVPPTPGVGRGRPQKPPTRLEALKFTRDDVTRLTAIRKDKAQPPSSAKMAGVLLAIFSTDRQVTTVAARSGSSPPFISKTAELWRLHGLKMFNRETSPPQMQLDASSIARLKELAETKLQPHSDYAKVLLLIGEGKSHATAADIVGRQPDWVTKFLAKFRKGGVKVFPE